MREDTHRPFLLIYILHSKFHILSTMLRTFFKFDWILIAAIALLSGVSLLTLYSISTAGGTDYFLRQAVFVGLGVGLMWFAAMLDYRHVESYSTALYFMTLAALLVLLLFGTTVRGTA